MNSLKTLRIGRLVTGAAAVMMLAGLVLVGAGCTENQRSATAAAPTAQPVVPPFPEAA